MLRLEVQFIGDAGRTGNNIEPVQSLFYLGVGRTVVPAVTSLEFAEDTRTTRFMHMQREQS